MNDYIELEITQEELREMLYAMRAGQKAIRTLKPYDEAKAQMLLQIAADGLESKLRAAGLL